MHVSFFDLMWKTSMAPLSSPTLTPPPGASLVTVVLTLFQFLRHLFFSPTYPCACLNHHSYSYIVTLPLNQVQIIFQAPA